MDTDFKERAYQIVDEFCEDCVTEDNIKIWCASRGVPHDVYEAFYESDLGAYCLLPQYGGWDGPFIARVWAAARLARRAGAILPFQTDFNSGALLSTMQPLVNEETIDDLVASNGQIVFSQAFSEGNMSQESADAGTNVSKIGGTIYLDGLKTYIANGQFIPETLVLTKDPVCGEEDGGMSLWLVPLDAEGVYTSPLNTVGQEMTAPASIGFDHVELDPSWHIQTNGKLKSILNRQYALGRIFICASSYGLAQAAFDDALTRSITRNVRGDILGKLSPVETMLAEMAVRLRAMETMIEKAALSVSDGSSFDELLLNCTLMKYYVPKAALEVADIALQIFGGAGYTDHTRVGRIWRDCRGNQLAQGADEMMIHTIAKQLVGDCATTMRDL